MKRLFVLFFASLLFIGGLSIYSSDAFAEEININELDEYALLDLEQKIQERLYEIDPTFSFVSYPGVYVVGEGIPAGKTIFTALEVKEGIYVSSGFVTVFQDYESYHGGTELNGLIMYLEKGESAQFYLSEGNIVWICDAFVSIRQPSK